MDFFNDISVYGESTAVITESSERISYRELLEKADTLKANLQSRCLVFCFCENNLESLVGYLGFLRANAATVMVSDSLHSSLIGDLVNMYYPQYIWSSKDNIITTMGYRVVYSFGNYVLFQTEFNIDYTLHDDLALLLTTSGSTGSPKLVRQSYRNIVKNANSIAEYLNINAEDRPITTLPMSYTYGLSIINSHLLKGCAIVMTNKTLMDKTFWEHFKNNNITSFGGVPYVYEMLKKLRFSHMNLPSLKVLTQAGGNLSLELCGEFATLCEEKGIRFVVMYGQTEATARMSYLPSEYAKSKIGSIGNPIPGGEFWLEDENGNKIETVNTAGELVYKGENVTMGYANSYDDLSKGDENGGVLKTGDIAKFDEDGFYYIVGRKKRFLKLFGNRINLDEVEQLLNRAAYDCACSGEDDKMKVFVTNMKNEDKLYRLISEITGIHRSGFTIISMDSIPRNEAGKVLYSSLS